MDSYHLSVPHDRADVIEGRQGLLHLEPSQEQPQTALEPGQGTTGEFFKGPVVWVGLVLRFFFQRGRVMTGIFLPDADAPVQG